MNVNVFLFILIIALLSFSLGGFWGVIWLPTKKKDYNRIENLVSLREGMVLYDLGSGTGDLLFYLSRKYKIKCVGIEISPILYLYSKVRSLFYRNVKIKYGNLFKYNLSGADIVYAFLHPDMYKELKEKIYREVKKETRIILACWPFLNEEPLKASEKNKGIPYYLYIKH